MNPLALLPAEAPMERYSKASTEFSTEFRGSEGFRVWGFGEGGGGGASESLGLKGFAGLRVVGGFRVKGG